MASPSPSPSPSPAPVVELTASNLINQGAEARLYRVEMPQGRSTVVKERFSKKYRHPDLDATLTKRRQASEVKCMQRANVAGVDTPAIYYVDRRLHRIYMEDIGTRSVKAFLWGSHTPPATYTSECFTVCRQLGALIARMHDANVVHGDLTTSNFMLRSPANTLVVIDFGLSFGSSQAEDKAVDLYVLERAFLCTHPSSQLLFNEVLAGYTVQSKNAPTIVKRLDQVRLRGRKKLAFG
eukprot:TRINITY_DN1211_c0_g4_i1.p1 TRINITY_DN1211_c0_g4~~TRINITY_DN1211_c0_g4_i1.p1  ORF type:complete len:238 (+),score=72.95 TRINITY_DN1211_c0_g4_i1:13-726(+)